MKELKKGELDIIKKTIEEVGGLESFKKLKNRKKFWEKLISKDLKGELIRPKSIYLIARYVIDDLELLSAYTGDNLEENEK